MKPPADAHYRHRFPAEIISHAVWLYHVFSLSLPDIELLLAERGIVVASYEAVRRWRRKFDRTFSDRSTAAGQATNGTSTRCSSGIRGVQHYLWRVVDQDGVVLDVLVQPRRDAKAAKGFFRRLLKAFQICPTRDRDRQAAKLRRGSAPTPAQR